jgi:hypothetical protein
MQTRSCQTAIKLSPKKKSAPINRMLKTIQTNLCTVTKPEMTNNFEAENRKFFDSCKMMTTNTVTAVSNPKQNEQIQFMH